MPRHPIRFTFHLSILDESDLRNADHFPSWACALISPPAGIPNQRLNLAIGPATFVFFFPFGCSRSTTTFFDHFLLHASVRLSNHCITRALGEFFFTCTVWIETHLRTSGVLLERHYSGLFSLH